MEQAINKKEYSIKEILSVSWKEFKESFKTILIIVLFVYIPINIILLFVPVDDTFESFKNYMKVVQVLEGLIGIIAVMAIAYVIKSKIDGKIVDFKEAFKKSFSRWPAAIWTNIILTVFLFGLTLLLVIPAIIYVVYWAFVLYAVVLCGKSGKSALDYSKSIVKGRWWTVLWYFLALIFLSFAAGMSVGFLSLFLLPEHWLADMATNTFIDIVVAYFIVAFTIFFLNFDETKTALNKADYNETV